MKCSKLHLFALTEEGGTVFVKQAKRAVTYFCPGCQRGVRVRGEHFFHLGCRNLSVSKSVLHQSIQDRFVEEIGAKIEVFFPSINRIADVVWEEEKIIFEVQCSPITISEVKARNKDYASLGYQVVWILYEKTFLNNYEQLRRYLLPIPHYFLRDSKEIFDVGGEVISFKKSFIPNIELPRMFELRRRYWKIFFSGDALDQFFNSCRGY